MTPEVITLDQLSLVISQAAAPAFLLGAVASFLSVLVSHMSRIIDRSRAINAISGDDPNYAGLKAALPQLKFRAKLVNRAIYWAVASGISTCLLMIAAFGSAYFGIRHEPGAAILFTLSLGLFTFSLISFAREVKVAMTTTEFG
jgi:hypothetical protein